MRILTLILLACTCLYLSGNAQIKATQPWFSEFTLEATVLLEKQIDHGTIPHGTGIVVHAYNSSHRIIITNEHVLRNPEIYVVLPLRDSLASFLNTVGDTTVRSMQDILADMDIYWHPKSTSARLRVALEEGRNVVRHPNGLDIAGFKCIIPGNVVCVPTSGDTLNFSVFDVKAIPRSMMSRRSELVLGDDCYFVGFPYMIGTSAGFFGTGAFNSESPSHLVRKASVAWMSNEGNGFLLDAFSYSGNSGSPVFRTLLIDGYPPYFSLIGIVTGHLEDHHGNIGLATGLFTDELLPIIEALDTEE